MVFSLAGVAMFGGAAVAGTTFLGGTSTISPVSSTVPGNGDLNPYGVAVVQKSVGDLVAGDVLVSNFNNGPMNQQGIGSTIVEISPSGSQTVFAHVDPNGAAGRKCGGVGFTTALAVLRRGWVIVGSLPTTDGMSATATAGCLFVLDSHGHVARVIRGGDINGPWDMTALDQGKRAVLFVTNVLNGTVAAGGTVVNKGTVVRIDLSLSGHHAPRVRHETVIGSGFAERTDPTALVVGPTGVALARDGILYVADTVSNRIAAIPDAVHRHRSALTGNDVTSNGALNGPLGMALAPNGDILTVNGGDGNAVETSPAGTQVATTTLDSSGAPPGSGALFGLAVAPDDESLYFVDDATNFLNRLH
jgi:sugar lactone lactonase YvrE